MRAAIALRRTIFGAFAFMLRFCFWAVLLRATLRAAIALRRATFGVFAFALRFCFRAVLVRAILAFRYCGFEHEQS
jgi:hypothetical protein